MSRQRSSLFVLAVTAVAGAISPVLVRGSTEAPAPGAAAFARTCAACHGANGQGNKAPPIVPLPYMEDQVAVVVRGGQGQMPPIPKAALSDEELSAIVAYLSQLQP
jgi:mono/diheme cytochrome c family protein